MKILHIFAELKPSGGEAMMFSAAQIWLNHANIHILSTGDKAVGVYAEKLASAGYEIHHIPFRKSIWFFLAVFKLLTKEQYDIVHLHTERASPWFALVSRLALGKSLILIRTVHHIFKFNGLLKFRKLIERYLMRTFLNVIIVSNSPSGLKNEIARYKSNNLLISNWYDNNTYQPPTTQERKNARTLLGYHENTCIFVSLGGNWVYKNYHLIVEALALLLQKQTFYMYKLAYKGKTVHWKLTLISFQWQKNYNAWE
jgi:hypothetical protein